MKKRFVLYRRGGVYYLEDTEARRRVSLQTSNRDEAEKLVEARNETLQQSAFHLAMGRTYLAAADPQLVERTWQQVMDEFCSKGKDVTRQRRLRGIRRPPFDSIRNKKLIETTGDDFRTVLAAGGVMTNCDLRCLHNLALGMGWLHAPIIPPKLWPHPALKRKRAITWPEQRRIIAAEKNVERRHYYELLWEVGAAQTDAASLTAEHIDWSTNTISYQRRKTGELACLAIGPRLAALLQQLPAKGPLFPWISKTTDSARSAEFYRRCRLLNIRGVSLHSYRYAWAQRAKAAGYPQRWAQNALGHNSCAVHQAYARDGFGVCPSLEDFEQRPKGNKPPFNRAPESQPSAVALPASPAPDPLSSHEPNIIKLPGI